MSALAHDYDVHVLERLFDGFSYVRLLGPCFKTGRRDMLILKPLSIHQSVADAKIPTVTFITQAGFPTREVNLGS